ncbi:hypothetical protein [Sorangium cellulosum]|uniref:Uncharacterized protein n=1 Tax=Sorangium cellulosum So0157-2 TaxID=1254432 RepID=S4XX68_SORCE|nr:hypothetical protein [Sorangium cellulosum]AGP36465.1 hypothetical protein SCE1572_19385 [Sorangium cellulosum So0157-2]
MPDPSQNHAPAPKKPGKGKRSTAAQSKLLGAETARVLGTP